MKLSELTKLVTKDNLDPEIYVTQFDLDDNGDILNIRHHEIEVEAWDDTDPEAHFDIFPGKLVSG